MENMKNLNDNELNEVSGGGIFDIVTVEDRVKMTNGNVCPNCGHAVGKPKLAGPWQPYYVIICEKCGGSIGTVVNSGELIKV